MPDGCIATGGTVGSPTKIQIRLLDRRAALQEWSTRPTSGDFAARIVSVGLIGVLPAAADLDGGLAQKSKRLSDRLKQGSRPKEFPKLQRIAIAGATGYIGGRLVPQLLASGYAVRCLVRSPAKLEGRAWALDSRVEIRRTDLADAPSLTRELEACGAAFYLVHSMMSAGDEYAQQDRQLALTFGRAAHDARVGRVIYLGGLPTAARISTGGWHRNQSAFPID